MYKIKICKVGNSLGTTFPKEITEALKVQEGDTLYLTKTPNGFELSVYDPEFERAIEFYREGASKYRNTLRELSK